VVEDQLEKGETVQIGTSGLLGRRAARVVYKVNFWIAKMPQLAVKG